MNINFVQKLVLFSFLDAWFFVKCQMIYQLFLELKLINKSCNSIGHWEYNNKDSISKPSACLVMLQF